MGLNYYMRARDEKLITSNFRSDEYIVSEERGRNYSVHLCKISNMWEPLFALTNAWHTARELLGFLERHEGMIQIIDEEGHPYSLSEFRQIIADRMELVRAGKAKRQLDDWITYRDIEGHAFWGTDFC